MKQRECIWRIQRQAPVLIASNVHYNVGVFFYFNLRIQIQYRLAKKKKKESQESTIFCCFCFISHRSDFTGDTVSKQSTRLRQEFVLRL